MYVVCDTNILISALLWKGELLPIYRLINKQKITLCFTEFTINELIKVSHYPHILEKAKKQKIDFPEIINTLISNSKVVFPKQIPNVIKEDTADNQFLACAITGKAFFVVSGDKHLLALKEFEGIPIVSPKDFLKVHF